MFDLPDDSFVPELSDFFQCAADEFQLNLKAGRLISSVPGNPVWQKFTWLMHRLRPWHFFAKLWIPIPSVSPQ